MHSKHRLVALLPGPALCLLALLPLALSGVCAASKGTSAAELAREEVGRNAQALFVARDFEAIEQQASELFATQARFPEGIWKLRLFLSWLEVPLQGEKGKTDWPATYATLDAWKTAKPESAWEPIVRAKVLAGHAWDARGDGWASTVTEEGWEKMRERLELAQSVLLAAPDAAKKCPEWHVVFLQVILGNKSHAGWTDEKVEEFVREAIALSPSYYDIYFSYALILLPRWHGEPGSWEKFMAEVARNNSQEGTAIYARTAWFLSGYHNNLFQETEVYWPTMREGFRQILRLTSDNIWNLNAFCYFAAMAGDWQTTSELLPRVGESPIMGIWKNPENFLAAKRLAAEQGSESGKLQPGPDLPIPRELAKPGVPGALAISPDGNYVAAGFKSGLVVLWNTKERTTSSLFTEPLLPVNDLAFSPDGKFLAGAGGITEDDFPPGHLWIWEVPALTLHAIHADWKGPACAVAFSRDGRWLAAGGGKPQGPAENVLLDMTTGEVSPAPWPSAHRHAITALAFTPDGRELSANCNRDISILDLRTGSDAGYTPDQKLPGQIEALGITPDGKTIIGVLGHPWAQRMNPGGIVFWDRVDGEAPDRATWKRRENRIPTVSLVALAVSPDGKFFATGTHFGSVILYETVTGREIASGKGSQRMLTSLAFVPKAPFVLSAGFDGAVRTWKIPSSK